MSLSPFASTVLMIVSALAFLLATWWARRPYDPGPGFRLPMLPIQFLSVFGFLVGFVAWLVQA